MGKVNPGRIHVWRPDDDGPAAANGPTENEEEDGSSGVRAAGARLLQQRSVPAVRLQPLPTTTAVQTRLRHSRDMIGLSQTLYRHTGWIPRNRPPSYRVRCIPKDHVKLGDMIGRGGYSCVYRGTFGTMSVAVKQINMESRMDDAEANEMVRNELGLLARLRDSNFVIQVVGYYTTDFCVSIVMAYADGDLRAYLHKGYLKGDWFMKAQICIDVAKAVDAVHRAGICHGDLKASNILLDGFFTAKTKAKPLGEKRGGELAVLSGGGVGHYSNRRALYRLYGPNHVPYLDHVFIPLPVLKPEYEYTRQSHRPFLTQLADFGYSKTFTSFARGSKLGETLRWMAPERIKNSNSLADEQLILADVYGYGLIMWEIFTDGRRPYEDYDDKDQNTVALAEVEPARRHRNFPSTSLTVPHS
ncbi:kinase-like domain-containing protein [Jimgerdemannia flammicorona]|uniref:Kinase-like domain-containing protein n=1 Tax=Jimgerdemannia flammicorona TaxID=994334 RepID=A0A433CXK1_9FUNG|nr:kinase-like domain-containing protein [Jimgerdemannia flammicorona]